MAKAKTEKKPDDEDSAKERITWYVEPDDEDLLIWLEEQLLEERKKRLADRNYKPRNRSQLIAAYLRAAFDAAKASPRKR